MAEPKETRPYLSGTYYKDQTKLTYAEWLRKTLQPMSEFDKPYLTSGYPEQEGYKPDDDPKPYDFDLDGPTDDSYPTGDDVPEAQPGPEDQYCVFEYDDIDDCSVRWEFDFSMHLAEIDRVEIMEIRGSGWAGIEWTEGIDFGLLSSGKQTGVARNYKDTVWIEPRKEKRGDGPGIIDIHCLMRHLRGELFVSRLVCFGNINISCCDGDTTALSFDDNSTADTIAQSASITLYMNGSGTPLTWEIVSVNAATGFNVGKGFSLTNEETSGTTNTLNADATACGSVVIRVTDCAGATVEFGIKCTTGFWDSPRFGQQGQYWDQGNGCSFNALGDNCPGGGNFDVEEECYDIQNDEWMFCKFTFFQHTCYTDGGTCFADGYDPAVWKICGSRHCHDDPFFQPICGDPDDCYSATGGTGACETPAAGKYCIVRHMDLYRWRCITG